MLVEIVRAMKIGDLCLAGGPLTFHSDRCDEHFSVDVGDTFIIASTNISAKTACSSSCNHEEYWSQSLNKNLYTGRVCPIRVQKCERQHFAYSDTVCFHCTVIVKDGTSWNLIATNDLDLKFRVVSR